MCVTSRVCIIQPLADSTAAHAGGDAREQSQEALNKIKFRNFKVQQALHAYELE
jgi:hypothetical protein